MDQARPPWSYNSGWRSHGIPRLSSGQLVNLTWQVIEKLRAAGVRVPPGNRLELAAKLAERVNETPQLLRADDPPLTERLAEAMRTMFEAFLIVDTALTRPLANTPFTRDALSYLFRGAELPREEKNPKGRNTQFELYVAAMLVLGGRDVWPGEPDLRMLYRDGETVGIAVKRVTSLNVNTLRSELRDAAQQLVGQQLRGFVALNLDPYLDQLRTDGDVEELGASFNSLLVEARRLIFEQGAKDALLGAFVFGNKIVWSFGDTKPRMTWHSPRQFLMFTENEREVEASREVFEPLQARLENALVRIGDHVAPG